MKKTILIILSLFHAGLGFASQEKAQVLDNNRLIDNDYAFELVKPSQDLRLLDEDAMVKMSPDAVAGIFNGRNNVFLAVIPELAPDAEPDFFVKMIADNMPLGDKQLVSEAPVTLDGFHGYQVFITGLINQVPFSYVIRVYKRGEFVFQTISWKNSSTPEQDFKTLQDVQSTFRFLTEQQPQTRHKSSNANFNGIGWRVKDNRYENVINGMKIELPQGWRFTGLKELKQINSEASVGLINGETGNYCIFIIERLGAPGFEQYKSTILNNFTSNNTFEKYEEKQLAVEGQTFPLHYFSNLSAGNNVSIDYVVTVFQKDDYVFQAINWWLSSTGRMSASKLPEVFSSISWLKKDEMPALRNELMALQDVDRSVVGNECYRNFQYRNFDFNLSIKFPKGFWSHAIDFAAREEDENVSLVMGNLEKELNLMVFLNRDSSLSGAEYHEAVLNDFGMHKNVKTIELSVNDRIVRSTRFPITQQNLPLEYNIATISNGDEHVRLMFYRIATENLDTQELEMTVLNGIEMGKHLPSASIIDKNGVYIDHRLGFRVRPPDENYKVEDITPQSIEKIGSLVKVTQKNSLSKSIGIKASYEYACGALHTDTDVRSFIEQVMFSQPVFKKSGLKMTSEQNIRWQGYDYKEFKYKSTLGLLKSAAVLRTALIGGTNYFYVAMSKKGVISEKPEYNFFRIIE